MSLGITYCLPAGELLQLAQQDQNVLQSGDRKLGTRLVSTACSGWDASRHSETATCVMCCILVFDCARFNDTGLKLAPPHQLSTAWLVASRTMLNKHDYARL